MSTTFKSTGWAGAAVSVYPRPGTPDAALGAAVGNSPQTPDASGAVTFTGLTDGTRYVASDGSRTVGFRTDDANYLPGANSSPGSAGSGGVVDQVQADTSQASSTVDKTSYLAGLLATAIAAGKQLRIPSGTWAISELVLPSNADVDARGATFVQLNGVNTRMILNTSLTLGTPGTARDSNIRWVGGTFVKGTGQTNVGYTNAGALGDHVTMFGFIDGLTVDRLTINQSGTGGTAGTGGRYGCYVWNCTNFAFTNYTAVSASQSVNQSTMQITYCQNGVVNGVYGTFGDDSVALVNGNVSFDKLANGASPIQNVNVTNVFTTGASNGVRIWPGSTGGVAPFYNVERCRISNVRGNYASRVGGNCAGVLLGGDTASLYPDLQNGTIREVTVEHVTQTRLTVPAVTIEGAAEISGVTLRDVNNREDSAAVIFPTSTGHQLVRIVDCDFTTAITTGNYYPIQVTSTVCRRLELENCRINAATTGTASVALVGGTGGPGWLIANACSATGKAFVLADFRSTTRLHAHGIEQEDANCLGWWTQNTGAVVTVCGWDAMPLAGVNGFTQTAGTVAIANGGGAVPGASGTAVLVGGTVTVNTGAGLVTAASRIRLTTIASGGTVGHCYVSSRGAGTFTITSTSGTDTSTILWEIVSS